MESNGFVIEAEEPGYLLDKNGWWTPGGRAPSEGYVHTLEGVKELIQKGRGWKRWELKPAWAYPAQWTQEQGTSLTSERLPFTQIV